jgi:hypothetical protein
VRLLREEGIVGGEGEGKMCVQNGREYHHYEAHETHTSHNIP